MHHTKNLVASGRRLQRIAAAPLLLTALLAAPTLAQAPDAVQAPAYAAACKTCHGAAGVSVNPAIPNLAGQKSAYLEAQLQAFKSKDRKNDLMNAIAAQLGDSDIHQLAAFWSGLPATSSAAAQASAGAPIHSRMTFPAGFPSGFTVYQTVVADGVMTRRYANAIAWKAAHAGRPLPDGSVVIQVSYKADKNAAGQDVAGAVQSYTGMESRAGWGAAIPVLLRNENWDYALFTADGQRRDQLNQAQCLACHKPMAADSYVFTMKPLRAATGKVE